MGATVRKKGELKISEPSLIENFESKLKSRVILVSKFDFEAEGSLELSVKKGDVMKLVDRIGDGWIVVKLVDRMTPAGMIPASYVDIAVNDPVNPITLSWLQKTDDAPLRANFNTDNFLEMEIKNKLLLNKVSTVNNQPYPTSASISNCLLFENRHWYRVDVAYSNGSMSFICRYYQNFYNLHISLMEMVDQIKKEHPTADDLTLPKLPEPMPSYQLADSKNVVAALLKRCQELNTYISKLIQNRNFQTSEMLLLWLDVSYKDLGGFSNPQGKPKMSNEEINNTILPDSVNALKPPSPSSPDSMHSPQLPDMKDAKKPMRSNSKNIYNHYQQARNIPKEGRKPSIKFNQSQYNSDVSNNSSSVLSHLSLFSKLSTRSLDSGNTEHQSSPPSPRDYVKCKIISGNDDISAMKINRYDIKSISDLKSIVRNKFYFKNLYVKLADDEEIESTKLDLGRYLSQHNKIILKIS